LTRMRWAGMLSRPIGKNPLQRALTDERDGAEDRVREEGAANVRISSTVSKGKGGTVRG